MATVQVGRITVNESEVRSLDESAGRSIKLSGIETTTAGVTVARIRALQADVANSVGLLVPVVFQSKAQWNGYYAVANCSGKLTDWWSQGMAICEWSFDLDLVGSANDIDIESRLSGPATLPNDHAGVGERWHAPAGGATAYWSGGAAPTVLTRTGSEGAIKVYRSLAAGVNPRWNCPANLYGVGRARFVDADGIERTGVSSSLAPSLWSLDNSLVRVTGLASAATFAIASHDGTQWESKNWNLKHNGTSLGVPVAVSVMRNDYECVVVRLMWNVAPTGRVWADLTLRRGSRFVEVYMRSMLSATLAVNPATTEASTAATGNINATANDAAGNRYTAGSSKTYSAEIGPGGFNKASTLTLDAYIGSAVGGSSAVAGDQAANLFAQFLGAPSERVIGVKI